MNSDNEILSTVQAAEYLGLPLRTFKRYIHDLKWIAGQKVGNSLAFSRAELDEFKAKHPKRNRGRPPVTK